MITILISLTNKSFKGKSINIIQFFFYIIVPIKNKKKMKILSLKN